MKQNKVFGGFSTSSSVVQQSASFKHKETKSHGWTPFHSACIINNQKRLGQSTGCWAVSPINTMFFMHKIVKRMIWYITSVEHKGFCHLHVLLYLTLKMWNCIYFSFWTWQQCVILLDILLELVFWIHHWNFSNWSTQYYLGTTSWKQYRSTWSYLFMAPLETDSCVGWTFGLTQNFHLFCGGFSTAGL